MKSLVRDKKRQTFNDKIDGLDKSSVMIFISEGGIRHLNTIFMKRDVCLWAYLKFCKAISLRVALEP